MNIENQGYWWKKAAAVLPFVALSIIIVPWLVGWDSLIDKILCIIIIVFFTIAVVWWYWAVDKVITVMMRYKETDKESVNMLTQLKHIRNLLEEIRQNK